MVIQEWLVSVFADTVGFFCEITTPAQFYRRVRRERRGIRKPKRGLELYVESYLTEHPRVVFYRDKEDRQTTLTRRYTIGNLSRKRRLISCLSTD